MYLPEIKWNQKSVINDFQEDIPIEDIASICSGVGFNTIPAWIWP